MSSHRLRSWFLSMIALTCFARSAPADCDVAVVLQSSAAALEETASAELVRYLSQLYPDGAFRVDREARSNQHVIRLGSLPLDPELARLVAPSEITEPESYVITSSQADGCWQLAIAGHDPRGVAYGVYALLQALGCDFSISGDVIPPPRQGVPKFGELRLQNAPLVRDRLVFNWHNFLSGCSTWNLSEWVRWTEQSQKLGFNTIMVHAYGNNPMVSFSFNGRAKPVGYLSTTTRGRDWATMHVNDVRRLHGGFAFDAPVFGADAASAAEDERIAAAQQLMREAFDHAAGRGMGVYFAYDVDTVSSNPQELILTLPEHARFPVSQPAGENGADPIWIADPDTAEGFEYYKVQVEALIQLYPQITHLVAWFRNSRTPWTEYAQAEMPSAWQFEFAAEVARTPDIAAAWRPHHLFGLAKVVRAWQRALGELGRGDIHVALGTWHFDFLRSADRFLPNDVALIGLDYAVLSDRSQLATAEARRVIGEVGARRSVIPVIWAHHDDGNYVGRPYTPFTGFATKLADAHAAGYGIIHWTTRPLELYFASHARQVWAATKDQPLRATTEAMASRWFGDSARGRMADYFERWITEGPKFGRETGDSFIDWPLAMIEAVVEGCRTRRAQLLAIDQAPLTAEQRERLDYFIGLEEFSAAVHETQAAYQRSQALLLAGELDAARHAIAEVAPEAIVENYARFSSLGGMTRGEQGLLITLNTRWLPHFTRHRQELGLEPVRMNFAPTSHEPLAQSAGLWTFHVDAARHIWECAGTKESGAATFRIPPKTHLILPEGAPAAMDEICRTGIESDQPIRFTLRPGPGGDYNRTPDEHPKLPPGRYRVQLFFTARYSPGGDERDFDVFVGDRLDPQQIVDRVMLSASDDATAIVVERRYDVTLTQPSPVHMTLAPGQGRARISAAVVSPEM